MNHSFYFFYFKIVTKIYDIKYDSFEILIILFVSVNFPVVTGENVFQMFTQCLYFYWKKGQK